MTPSKSTTLAGGLIWAEDISGFDRRRKLSFHSNVCGCINLGYFRCRVIKTQFKLLWGKQEYTGSQLKSEGGGVSSWGKVCVNPERLIASWRCNLSTFTHPQVLPFSSLNKFALEGSLVIGEQGWRCKRILDLVLLKFFPWGETNNTHPSFWSQYTNWQIKAWSRQNWLCGTSESLGFAHRAGITPKGAGVPPQEGAPGKLLPSRNECLPVAE